MKVTYRGSTARIGDKVDVARTRTMRDLKESMVGYRGYSGLERGRECNKFGLQAVRKATCNTASWRIGRDSPTSASKKSKCRDRSIKIAIHLL